LSVLQWRQFAHPWQKLGFAVTLYASRISHYGTPPSIHCGSSGLRQEMSQKKQKTCGERSSLCYYLAL
ncbi:MAG TPA: hypothetical protein VF988_03860, partial [Verrucomicrobiae bacterium]